jgi:hypothetical protein
MDRAGLNKPIIFSRRRLKLQGARYLLFINHTPINTPFIRPVNFDFMELHDTSSHCRNEPIHMMCTGKQFTERRVPKIDGNAKLCIIVM